MIMKPSKSVRRALELAELDPVSTASVLTMSLTESHERLAPYFADLPLQATGVRATWHLTATGMRNDLLGTNLKTEKAAPIPCRVRSLALAPATEGGSNFCAFSCEACRNACISECGQYRFDYSRALRIAKSIALVSEPVAYVKMLIAAIAAESHRATKVGVPLFVRPNTLSDIPWEYFAPMIFDFFENWPLRFYDYTKIPDRDTPSGYHLTFSRSGSNDRHVASEIKRGRNIAVVFEDEDQIPDCYLGLPVIRGDDHDVRLLDPPGQYVIALRFKRPATGATPQSSGNFVVLTNSLAA